MSKYPKNVECFQQNFEISWKHIVVGFNHGMNEKTILFTNLISFVALRFYEYKIWCRLNKEKEM